MTVLRAHLKDAISLASSRRHRMNANSMSSLAPLPPGQFRVFEKCSGYAQDSILPNSTRLYVGDFIVECNQLLHATVIHDSNENVIGAVLGNTFIAETSERLSSLHFKNFISSTNQRQAFEDMYQQLFGTFIILLRMDGGCYVYLDAGGCLSAVYSQELKIAGSTAAAILSAQDYDARFQRDLYTRLDVAREGWFPSGLTAHRNVSRLLCNHRLDLKSLTAARHWPANPPVRSPDDSAVLDKIEASVRNNLNAVMDNFPAAMALTAGTDSRILLSLTRERSKKPTTYIVDARLPNTELDVHVSKQLAEQAGLNHKILPVIPTGPEIQQRWHFRCGHSVGGLNARIHTALSGLDNVQAVMDGTGGETAKCFFWKKSDDVDSSLTGEMIVRRFGMPVAPEVVEATNRWLAGVPRGDA